MAAPFCVVGPGDAEAAVGTSEGSGVVAPVMWTGVSAVALVSGAFAPLGLAEAPVACSTVATDEADE